MHVPPIPDLAAADPEIAELIEARGRSASTTSCG